MIFSRLFLVSKQHLCTKCQQVKSKLFKVYYNLQLVLKFIFGVHVVTTLNAQFAISTCLHLVSTILKVKFSIVKICAMSSMRGSSL